MRLVLGLILFLFTSCSSELPQRKFKRDVLNPKKTDFVRQSRPYSDLNSAKSAGLGLRYSILWGSTFVNAQLPKADFRYSDLTDADFTSANLRGASFTGAILTGARFVGADLRGARFEGAIIWNTNFTGIQCDEK